MTEEMTFPQKLANALLRLLGHLPLGVHHAFAKVIAFIIRKLVRYRTDVVRENLDKSFPEKSPQEIDTIQKKFYRHFANIFTEALWFGSCRGDRGRRRLRESHIVEITNPEEFNRILRQSKQVMILQSHTGNWELFGGILNYTYGEPLVLTTQTFAITYLPLHSKFWDRFMKDGREAPVRDMNFNGYIPTNDIIRHVQKHAGTQFCYSFITDQYPYSQSRKHTVQFLNRETPTMTGSTALACRMDMAVLYLRFECRENGGYSMTFVPMAEHASEHSPMELIGEYYSLLEADIRKQPWNYLWTHRRWK